MTLEIIFKKQVLNQEEMFRLHWGSVIVTSLQEVFPFRINGDPSNKSQTCVC